jgi:hypothetical protein
MSGINGAGYAHHFVDAHIATGYPSVNAHFTPWWPSTELSAR